MAENEFISNLSKADTGRHLIEEILVYSPVGANTAESSRVLGPNEADGTKQQPNDPQFVHTATDDEPIVTRKELWSYYCALWDYRTYKLPVNQPLDSIL